MPIANAINIIRAHQRWRLGFARAKSTDSRELTNAINVVLEHHGKRVRWPQASEREAALDRMAADAQRLGLSYEPMEPMLAEAIWEGGV